MNHLQFIELMLKVLKTTAQQQISKMSLLLESHLPLELFNFLLNIPSLSSFATPSSSLLTCK